MPYSVVLILAIPFFSHGQSACTGDRPLPVPRVAAEKVESTSLTFGWESSPSTSVVGYVLSRQGKRFATVPVGSNYYTDSNLTAETSYQYSVRAIDGCGNISTPVALGVLTAPLQPPVPVVSSQCSFTDSSGDDFAYYISGLWITGQNEWNAAGITHSQTLSINRDTFPNCTQYSWTYPAGWNQVYAYPLIKLNSPSTAIAINKLTELVADYDVAIAGDTGLMHVAWDIWLTNSTISKNGTVEIMIGTHEPEYLLGSNQPFTLTTQNLKYANVAVVNGWSASETDPGWLYVNVQPTKDMLSGSMNILSILRALYRKGILTGQEQIMPGSLQFGTEIIGGSGSYLVNHFNYSIQYSQ